MVILPADTWLNEHRRGIVGLSGGLRVLGTAHQAPLALILPKDTEGVAVTVPTTRARLVEIGMQGLTPSVAQSATCAGAFIGGAASIWFEGQTLLLRATERFRLPS